MAANLVSLLLTTLVTTMAFGSAAAAPQGFFDFGSGNGTAFGGGPFGPFIRIPQQIAQGGVQVAQQTVGQGVAAGQQAAQVGFDLFANMLRGAIDAALQFNNMTTSFIPRGNSSNFPFPFPLPFPFPFPGQTPIRGPPAAGRR